MSQKLENFQFLCQSKKALGAVVAISLLIVVAVGSVLSFQSFYQSYSSDLHSKIDSKSDSGKLEIQSIVSQSDKTTIYIKNPSNTYTKVKNIQLNGVECNLLSSDIVPADSILEISTDCLCNKMEKIEIIIFSDFGVFTGTYLAR